MEPMTVVVIGGGFSGTAVAAHLVRVGRGTRILLINRYGPMGRGVAYSTSLEDHRLNVPAGQMSLLTMMDIALDLHRRGVRSVAALSRRGLLPQAHRTHRGAVPRAAARLTDPAAPTILSWLSTIRGGARRIVAAGGDWRELFAALRPRWPVLWRQLPIEERRRFLRHLRPYWDIHRHRAAPATAETIARLRQAGWLTVRAGRIRDYRSVGIAIEVSFRPRGTAAFESFVVDRVIDCTGPDGDIRRLPEPLLQSLLASGFIRPDPLRLGIEADSDGAVLDAAGTPSSVMFLVGTLLKARDWECTAVPELREHARRLARHLVGTPTPRGAALPSPP